jgi:hypothetical protein
VKSDPFRRAIEAKDLDGMVDALADDAVLHSPVTFKPFEGKAAVRKLFSILLRTFEDFHYTDELHADGLSVLVFRTRIGTREVEGMDLLRYDGAGKIADFTVMVRPMSAVIALAETVGPQL